MEKQLRVCLHVLSPVHIGCGDVYEPTGFIVNPDKKQMTVFDPLDFIKHLDDKGRSSFTATCSKGTVGSIIELFDYISSHQGAVHGRSIEIAQHIAQHYNEKIRKLKDQNEKMIGQELNNFAINRTAYNPQTDLPYIPGSSIKGAFRTAYLSMLAKDTGIKNYWEKSTRGPDFAIYKDIGKKRIAKQFEKELLKGDFATDPFRMVKVSDFLPVGQVKTKIVYAVNKKKALTVKKSFSKQEDKSPFQILEILMPGNVFLGTISIQQPDKKAGIEKPVTIDILRKALYDFYVGELEQEEKMLKVINVGCNITGKAKADFDGRVGKNTSVVRIGRHSGAEAVTIEENRLIKIMQGRGKQDRFLDHATTVWLASDTSKPVSNNGLQPFGWIVLEETEKSFDEIKIEAPASFGEDMETRTVHLDTPVHKPPAAPVRAVDKFITQIKCRKATDAGAIGTVINEAIAKLESDADKKEFAHAVKTHMGAAFNKSKAKIKLAGFLD